MKTSGSKSKTEVAVFKDMNSNTASKQGKKAVLGIVTEASGDKENLMKCRMPSTTETLKQKIASKDLTTNVEEKASKNEEKPAKCKVTAEDLTSEAGPSEGYWECIAERRRLALAETLSENAQLHQKVDLLQQEIELLKQSLSEATDVIDVLKEILDGKDEETDIPVDISTDVGLGNDSAAFNETQSSDTD